MPVIMTQKVSAYVRVSGQVQGVFFRSNCQEKAQELGLTGWVRNLVRENAVEAVFEGELGKVKAMVEWMKQGPPSAEVKDHQVDWGRCSSNYKSFEVL